MRFRRFIVASNHPITSDGTVCPFCKGPFVGSQEVVLWRTLPAEGEEGKARAGRPYNSEAAIVHWACVPEEFKDGETH